MSQLVDQATAPPVDRTPALTSALIALGPATHALLRAGSGFLFLQHGLQKLFGMLGGFGGTPGTTAPLASLMGLAGVLEFVGGLLLVIGLFTRPVAFVLVGEMLVAFFLAHFPRGGWPIQNGGELALLYALVFAFLAANGAGPASIDARLRGTRPGRTTLAY
jgi:putative oxidoreductase